MKTDLWMAIFSKNVNFCTICPLWNSRCNQMQKATRTNRNIQSHFPCYKVFASNLKLKNLVSEFMTTAKNYQKGNLIWLVILICFAHAKLKHKVNTERKNNKSLQSTNPRFKHPIGYKVSEHFSIRCELATFRREWEK